MKLNLQSPKLKSTTDLLRLGAHDVMADRLDDRSDEFRLSMLGRSVLWRGRDVLLLLRDAMPKDEERSRLKEDRVVDELRLSSRFSASSRRAVALPIIGASGGGSVR